MDKGELTTTALIMAGGRSTRMRASRGRTHKGLIPIAGLPLAERVLYHALSHGLKDIIVACSRYEPELSEFFEVRARGLAEALGGTCRVIYEDTQLGTIGAARLVAGRTDPIVVLNVDNLIDIDLTRLVECHVEWGAALTIASHKYEYRVPYGELVMEGTQVLSYREKPTVGLTISSGTYVLDPMACSLIPPEGRTDIPTLVSILHDASHGVHAYRHSANWVDVNDAEAVEAATALVMANQWQFDTLGVRPDRRLMLAVDLARRVSRHSDPVDPPIGVFDEVEVPDGDLVRYEVYLVSEAGDLDVEGRIAARAVALANGLS